jgi:hypothetical protein
LIHHRDAEDAEITQTIAYISLRLLCVLCVSVVNVPVSSHLQNYLKSLMRTTSLVTRPREAASCLPSLDQSKKNI